MKKKEQKKLTRDQAEKKIVALKKDLLNIRFKKLIIKLLIQLNTMKLKKVLLDCLQL